MWRVNAARPSSIVEEVASAVHEIGNHSYTHARFDFKSPDFIYNEMELAQETIRKTTGSNPSYFRAPYGVRWFGLRRAQQRLGLTGVMWTVIGRDWTLSAPSVTRRLLDGASNGGILCLQDGRTILPHPISPIPSMPSAPLFQSF